MHLEILSKEQVALLPILSSFKKEYYLVGGTAIALHIDHRESLDFDLFKEKNIRKKDLYSKLNTIDYKVSFAEYNQVNMMSSGVKITLFSFPYKIPTSCILENYLKMPDLLTLAAMKAFALGRRTMWKD
jgi:hypothetical protein